MKRGILNRILLAIPAVFIVLWILLPIYWMVVASIVPEVQVSRLHLYPRLDQLSLQSYIELFTPGDVIKVRARGIQQYLWNSVVVASFVMVISLMIGSIGAYAISRIRFRGRDLFSGLILFTYVFPSTVLMAPIYLYVRELGLGNSFAGVIFMELAGILPFSTWLLMGYFQELPLEIEESALVDGCSRLQVLLKIVFPISLPGLVTAAIYAFVSSWDAFVIPLIILDERHLWTLPIVTRQMIYGEYIKWSQINGVAVICAIVPAVLFGFMQKYIVRGLAAGAVKG
ncbi:carbohydrate ABC transporter permease [Candidatus Bathyarchaeota archaeon]|nr:carbohydrate ABC transporter permease [Candidatus Bathyarchaeota archaeon]